MAFVGFPDVVDFFNVVDVVSIVAILAVLEALFFAKYVFWDGRSMVA